MRKKICKGILLLIIAMTVLPVQQVNAATGNWDWRWPVPSSNVMSACYIDGRAHYAIDIRGNKGADVYASYPGTVIATYSSCTHNYRKYGSCGCEGGLGNNVYIKHNYNGTDYVSRYGHLSTVNVSVGDVITENRIIGTLGCTGYSMNDHLDFRVYKGDSISHIGSRDAIDPLEEQFIPLPEGFHANANTGCCYSYAERVMQLQELNVTETVEEQENNNTVEINGKSYDIETLYHIEKNQAPYSERNTQNEIGTALYLTVYSAVTAKILFSAVN